MAAGSIVRTTGSGMGCPDWPKCFDQVIPPTNANQLPANYKEKYIAHRKEKIEKFARILTAIGFEKAGQQLIEDEDLLIEADFNASKTWIEYGNRLIGFIAGNLVLITLIWVLIRYRTKRNLLALAFLNLLLMGFEGWFGSIVVATNLVPWTITIHMLFALIIVAIQVKIIRIAKNRSYQIKIKPIFKSLFYLSLALTFVQIILGAQVRQEVDFLVKDGIDRSVWIEGIGGDFLFHRSFSWVLLIVNTALLWLNKKWNYGIPTIKFIFGLIIVEFITGVLFSYAGMPAIIQPLHLLVASVLLGIQFYTLDYFKYTRESLIR
jgi:cytochrome c oxidase assembly protein subunit 15